MITCPYPLDSLLPHARPMILLDEIVGRGRDSLTAALLIRPGIPFFRPGRGIASHIGLEWMAQTCGAFAGAKARDAGEPVRIGLLLGTRQYTCSVPWLAEGTLVLVTATELFADGQIGSFDCSIARDGDTEAIAKAQLTVYQPENAAALLAGQLSQVRT